ncbi:MAG: putative methionine gamma-lyase [Monoraphidium minutum]|nr:MAG: putative methionine gamma-lyase [Monoraphidium minutum]
MQLARGQRACHRRGFAPFTNARPRQTCRDTRCWGERRSANRASWALVEPDSEVLGGSIEQHDSGKVTAQAAEASVETAEDLIWRCAAELAPAFASIDRRVARNLRRAQEAFRAARVGPHHFQGSTGYGHGDLGREALDHVFAEIMGAEAGLVRIQFMSGTHAIAAALYAVLRPGDEMLAVAGKPYDTLEEVIGLRGTPGHGSLAEWGVSYRELALAPGGGVDWDALATAIVPGKTRVAHVQRSCGYALRPTLSIDEIERIVRVVKAQDPNVVVVVDNCYGEFTEDREPPAVGADLAMGSLIKNGGGTLAPGGGYVAGRADLVAAAAARLAAPGIGIDAGGVSGETLRILFQGLFMGAQTTGEALKGGRLVAQVMASQGFNVIPAPGMDHTPSMITAVELGSPQRMEAFCRGIQRRCAVGSYILPVPGVTAGYGDEVIFADGTFVDGSTAELSADGPLRPPYVVYCQGGTHWTHWAIALESAIEELRKCE